MSERPPGEDIGRKFGDERLNQTARHISGGGGVIDVFRVKEEGDTLNIKCQVCEVTVYGLKNLNNHINGKRHQSKFSQMVRVILVYHLNQLYTELEAGV